MNKAATAELQAAQLDAIAAQGAVIDVVPIATDTALPRPSRAIRCIGAGGTLRVVTAGGEQRDSKIAPDQVLPWAITKVIGVGTTATQLEAWL